MQPPLQLGGREWVPPRPPHPRSRPTGSPAPRAASHPPRCQLQLVRPCGICLDADALRGADSAQSSI